VNDLLHHRIASSRKDYQTVDNKQEKAKFDHVAHRTA
jgi:hypothetical protein